MKSQINNNSKIRPEDLIESKLDTPLISDKVYEILPKILQDGCNQFTIKRERDMFLLGSLVLMSGSLQNVYGFYDRKKVYCPIYAMVVAPPASGKGVLVDSLKYVEPIQEYLADKFKDKQNSHRKLSDSAKADGIEISASPKPVQRKLVIPANSSSAAFMKLLKNSKGEAIIFETEADSLSSTLKNDWGNYSDILRKAFHHEPVTASRVDENADIDISCPKLAVLISGTLDQVAAMKLNDPTNGLQSRFLFYFFESLPKFKKVSPDSLSDNFNVHDKLGGRLLDIYKFLESNDYEVRLTELQWKSFQMYFEGIVDNLVIDYNGLYNSMITRHALTAFRLAMVITTLRQFENNIPASPIYCTKKDILVVFHLMESLIEHGTSVFYFSKKSNKDKSMSQFMEFLKILPDGRIFSRQEAIDLGSHIFSPATIDRRLNKLKKNGHLISNVSGSYKKV